MCINSSRIPSHCGLSHRFAVLSLSFSTGFPTKYSTNTYFGARRSTASTPKGHDTCLMTLSDEVPSSSSTISSQDHQGSPLYAALARTTTRAIALYFSRPVRLFRPSKVSGWHSLRGHAHKHGTTLSPQYVISLIKNQGFMVIPKHFIPPMLANAVLGTVLWTTYTECSGYLEARFKLNSIFVATLSGAAAGGMQALVAAPVENVRSVIEGGTGRGWSHAWKEVFRGTESVHRASRSDRMRDIRQLRLWMKDVGEMAGRGWTGWSWSCGKDICGFAAFFTVFEITREAATRVKAGAHHVLQRLNLGSEASHNYHLPRIGHAVTLVCGGAIAGLTYETLCRPWDVARRTIELHQTHAPRPSNLYSLFSVLAGKVQEDGITSFFRDHDHVASLRGPLQSNIHRRISSALRTLGRVGPWGVGFLVWEALGPGLH